VITYLELQTSHSAVCHYWHQLRKNGTRNMCNFIFTPLCVFSAFLHAASREMIFRCNTWSISAGSESKGVLCIPIAFSKWIRHPIIALSNPLIWSRWERSTTKRQPARRLPAHTCPRSSRGGHECGGRNMHEPRDRPPVRLSLCYV